LIAPHRVTLLDGFAGSAPRTVREKETMRHLALTSLLAFGLATTCLATATPSAAQQPPSSGAPGSSESQVPPPPPPPAPPPLQIVGVSNPFRVQAEVLPRKITDWQEGEPIPPGYVKVQQLRTGRIVGGAVTLGVMWLLSALAAASMVDNSNPGGGWLYVPVIGPFAELGNNTSTSGATVLVIDGVAQAAGAALLISGLTDPKTVLVREYAGVTFAPTPLLGRDQTGVGVVGTF
jgi:hypothetical protein